MDARDRYFWDLTGYLVLRQVLSPSQVKARTTPMSSTLERCSKWTRRRGIGLVVRPFGMALS